VIFLVLLATRVAAQAAPLQLEPVVVTATRNAQPLGTVAASLSVLEGLDVQGAQRGVGLEELLDRVPGVLVQSSENFAQDVRIQIRGFGTRSAFGIREVRVLLDGLPATQPDGQTQIDDIDLGSIERIEVLRGPAGALYGNASGGVIQLFSEDAPPVPTARLMVGGGSYDFGKYLLSGGARAGNVSGVAYGSFLQLGGYRDHSATQAGTWLAKLRWEPSDASDVTLLANGVDTPEAEDPGALTAAQAQDDPRQAREVNVALDAGEAVRQARLGAIANHRGAWGDLNAYAYVLTRDFQNALPIAPDGIVAFDRLAPGGGLRWTLATPLFGVHQALTAGLDLQYQDDDRTRHQNLAGARGPLVLRQREQVGGVGPYLREAVDVRDDLELSVGVRYDAVFFDVDVQTPPGSPDSGSRTFDQVSPTGAVRWTWLHGRPPSLAELSVFGTIGTAFQTPTTTELANPNGPGFNPAVAPQTSVTYELGSRARWQDWLNGGGAAYVIEVDDELVPYESDSGRTAYRNAGRSRRYGLELDWQAQLLAPLRWSGAVTLLKAEYRDYRLGTENFAGNDEPGIPQWWIYQELFYQHESGLFAALEVSLVDGYFVNDANDASTAAYQLLNLRVGYQHDFGAHWSLAPYVGLNNLADQNYNGTTRLNAQGGRYFEPAPTFNVYGGIAVIARM